MSGSIFGDDDDFELVGGSDTPSAIRKPTAEVPAVRPVTRPTPSTPTATSGESKNPSNRGIPAVANPSALPRPQLPSPTVKQRLPIGRDEASSGSPKQPRTLPERGEVTKPVTPTVSEINTKPVAPTASERVVTKPVSPTVSERVVRDTAQRSRHETTPVQTAPTVAPVNENNNQTQDRPAAQSNRYFEKENTVEDTVRDTRRSARNETSDRHDDRDNDLEDRFANRRFTNASTPEDSSFSQRDESPRNLYTQKPYVPAENTRPAPSRVVDPPVQSYPEARTAPAVKHSQQDSVPNNEKPAKAGRASRAKKQKVEKTKGPNPFSGGRSGVVVVRVFAVMVVTVLMLAGGKSIFFPTQIPDPTTITNVVKKRLGVTNFPAEGGQAFVTSFARLYLTVDPTNISSTDIYAPYMTSTLASNMTASNGASGKQTITEGPIISGIKSVDDTNAIYTVGAKLSSGANWVYVDVPVYYDKDKVGFAVSGMPAFAPAPTKITAPPAGAPFERDSKLGDSVKSSVMEQFFPAWAASNTNGINLVVLGDANSEAKIGLANAVKFVSIQDFIVEIKQPGDAEETTRKAQATVVWASPTDPKITYTQQYNMVLFRQPDNRWYIKELTSGVRS